MGYSYLNDKTRVEQYLKRYSAAASRADLWRGLLWESFQYFQSERNRYMDNLTDGAKKNIYVYDNVGVIAMDTWVSKTISSLIPSGEEWCLLEPGEDIPEELRPQIARGLQFVTKLYFRYLNQSNFSLAASESMYDAGISTGALLAIKGKSIDNPIEYCSVPTYDYKPEEGPNGTINTSWRQYLQLPANLITQIWPDAILTDELKRLISQTQEDGIGVKTDFIEGVVYNEDAPEKSKYCYSVISLATKDEIVYAESASSPWIVFRPAKLSSVEIMGRGPGIKALPTVQTCNKIVEFWMRTGALATSSTYMGFSDDVFNPNTAVIIPNTVIPINRSSGTTPPLQLLPTNNHGFEINQDLLTDLRNQVFSIFNTKPLGDIEDLGKATATEVSYRTKEYAELIAPTYARFENELLKPLINRGLFLLSEWGIIPPIPIKGEYKTIQIDGKAIQLRYKSSIQKASSMQNVLNLQQAVNTLAGMIGPQLTAAALNLDTLPEYVAEQFNVELNVFKTPQEIRALAQQAQQAAQQQLQAQSQQNQAGPVNPGVQQQLLQGQGVI